MGYSLDPISDNCYPGTAVLINKFDIRDEAKLNEVETVLVPARGAEWMEHPKEVTPVMTTNSNSCRSDIFGSIDPALQFVF